MLTGGDSVHDEPGVVFKLNLDVGDVYENWDLEKMKPSEEVEARKTAQ